VPERAPEKPTSDYRGDVEFFFEVVGGRAREINRRSAKMRDRHQLQVRITLASIDGRTRCVGVEIRSYERTDTDHGVIKPFEHRDGFTEIGSALWRSIPIGDLIERAIAGKQAEFKRLAEWARGRGQDQIIREALAPEIREAVAREIESLIDDDADKPHRGPQRLLSLHDLATVIAPAYQSAGRKPVVAVRDALSKHTRQTVTMDQARKAVVRAREAGVLPRAHGRGKP
jgi:hypothetical protein